MRALALARADQSRVLSETPTLLADRTHPHLRTSPGPSAAPSLVSSIEQPHRPILGPETDMFALGIILAALGSCTLPSQQDNGPFLRSAPTQCGPDPEEVRSRVHANLNATTSPHLPSSRTPFPHTTTERRPHAYALASLLAEAAVACSRPTPSERSEAVMAVAAFRVGLEEYDRYALAEGVSVLPENVLPTH